MSAVSTLLTPLQELELRIHENVPAQLQQLPVWLLWERRKGDDGKWKKIPVYANGRNRSGALDSAQDREQLVAFDQATQAMRQVRRAHGYGVALGEVPGEDITISGIDFDGCYRGDVLDERVAQILAAACSYAEKSPSGTGIHILGTGRINTQKKDELGFEIYSGGRFFTVTGEAINAAPLSDLTEAAALVHSVYGVNDSNNSESTHGQSKTGRIPDGGRNKFLSRKAYGLRKDGLSVETILPVLRELNLQCCDPPLADDEVTQIARGKERIEPDHGVPAPSLVACSVEEFLAPIPPERFLLPGIPADAYTIIAGALSSYKTTLLVYLIIWKATGFDLLNLDPHGNGIEIGKAILVTYEDTDRRALSKLQLLIQQAYREISRVHGSREADIFIHRCATNIRRLSLSGEVGSGIIRRAEGGLILPNEAFLEPFFNELRAFAPEGALVGIDPLRLAIVGSQNDDDGADIAVHTLNRMATHIPGTGLVVCSHTTKNGAQDSRNDYASASYATSGSALYSQHARSNYHMARMSTEDIGKTFHPDDVTHEVAQLTHGRLSHGIESASRYVVMRGGVLVPVQPRRPDPAETMRTLAKPIVEAIDRIKAAGLRVSAVALEDDPLLLRTMGKVTKIRTGIKLLISNYYLHTEGTTTNRNIVVSRLGRRLVNGESLGESEEDDSR